VRPDNCSELAGEQVGSRTQPAPSGLLDWNAHSVQKGGIAVARFYHASILNRYIVSYLLVITLPILIIGTFIFQKFENSLNQEIESNYKRKIERIAADFSYQMQDLKDISRRISNSEVCRLYAVQPLPYNEILLFNSLSNYKGRNVIVSDFLFYFKGSEYVYSPQAKYYPYVFFKNHNVDDFDALLNQANRFTQPGIIRHDMGDDAADLLVYVYPASYMMGGSSLYDDIMITFLIPADLLQARFEQVAGGLDGNLSIYQNGLLLYSDDPLHMISTDIDSESQVDPSEPQVTHYQDSYLFDWQPEGSNLHFQIKTPIESITRKIREIRVYNLSVLILISLISFAFSLLFAYRNYNPIRQIQDQLSASPGVDPRTSGNEILNIRAMMQQSRQFGQGLEERLREQKDLLRQQALGLLLRGDTGLAVHQMLSESGIDLRSPWFLVFFLAPESCGDIPPYRLNDRILQAINKMPVNPVRALYATDFGSVAGITILAALQQTDSDTVRHCADEILDTLQAGGLSVRIGIGKAYDNCDLAHLSYSEAVAALNISADRELIHCFVDQAENGGPIMPLTLSNIFYITQAIKTGNLTQALEQAECTLNEVALQYPSYLLQKCISFELLNNISRAAAEVQVDIPTNLLSPAVNSNQFADFRIALRDIVMMICQTVNDRQIYHNTQLTNQLVGYIHENGLAYDMSLEKVSEHFKLSENNVGRLVKEATGCTFREYLTLYRMDKARQLLFESPLTIGEISQAVGYANVSHFIKTFKNTFSATPAQLRKQ
jgi:two-component system, response regulator YesN